MQSVCIPIHLLWVTYPKPDVTEKARLVTIFLVDKAKAKDETTYGGIKEMSVLEPPPGVVGFLRVVSTSVQRSPLSPQLPSPLLKTVTIV